MSGLLKSYIKLLIESAEDNETKYADIITTKNQEMQNQTFYGDELNRIINELNKNYTGVYGLKDLLKQNGYSLIGQGGFRNVWTRSDVDFVIKINNSLNDNSNQIEYNTYFGMYQYDDVNAINTTEQYYDVSIYPKLYGYDKIHGHWIIFEKVNTFNQQTPLYTFFPLLFKQIKIMWYIICKDLNLKNNFSQKSMIAKNELLHHVLIGFQILQETTGSYQYNYDSTENETLFNPLFELFYQSTFTSLSSSQFIMNAYKALKRRNFKLQVTPDIGRLLKGLRGHQIDDLHSGNLGYRKIKDPNKPWESVVIIDYQM